ncbi:hypothetical protein VTI74DRAFT_3402 [Chaetomium olivicolor]
MATRPTLPYFAPAHILPAPLPTLADILASTKVLSAPGKTRVVRVGNHFAVKYGKDVQLQEGENMLFVQQSSTVPVPTVYALFYDDDTDKNFIIYEFIPGRKLSAVWRDLCTADKMAIASQLRRNMDELRSIPSPGYYGGIWRQPTQDLWFRDPELMSHPHANTAISGPQQTEEQWTESMWRCLDTRSKTARRQYDFLSIRRRHYHPIFKGHKPVFTHSDFGPENMILREDNKTVVLIDWEQSGWYPCYWEYCNAMFLVDYRDDWGEWLPEILDEYVAELGWMAFHREFLLFY